MDSPLRKRPRIGDVIEFPTPRGLAYAHYTHRHTARPVYGPLLRVFSGFHERRPPSFGTVVRGPVQFTTFFPVGTACNRGDAFIVANEPIPANARDFPTFRSGIAGPDGRVAVWWLWDGEKSRRVGALTAEMCSLPIRGVWNRAMLMHRILSEWRPEDVT
jgi:hypothetical protein